MLNELLSVIVYAPVPSLTCVFRLKGGSAIHPQMCYFYDISCFVEKGGRFQNFYASRGFGKISRKNFAMCLFYSVCATQSLQSNVKVTALSNF